MIGFVKVTRDFSERMQAAEALRRANVELQQEVTQRRLAEQVARTSYEQELALRQDEQRFRLFVEAVSDYAIYTLDPKGFVTSWNQGAERIKGYSATEIVGSHFSRFFSPEDIRDGKPQQELRVAAEQGRFDAEAWRVRKSGDRFWANIVLTAIKDENGGLIGFVKVTRDFTERMHAQWNLERVNSELAAEVQERKAAEQKLAASEKSLRELSLHLLRSQDEERRRIGRELHDSLGQYLAMLKMHLDSMQLAQEGAGEALIRQLARCVRLADDCIAEVRTISYLLYPPMLEEVGLRSAIAWFLEGFAKRSNIKVSFEAEPSFGRLNRDLELALFRVLQESLTNVHRHSGSTSARVVLSASDALVTLEIADNGNGIPEGLLRDSGQAWVGSLGVGLRGMHERMKQLGGNLRIASSQQGTTVKASVPTEEPPARQKTSSVQ
ncbi:MAG: PAS domain-containing sensor histidine kinase [Acidobacteriales bacterium]|nr:PAS domain-containing sensor histidine kinase [Terriglobales bacterium]